MVNKVIRLNMFSKLHNSKTIQKLRLSFHLLKSHIVSSFISPRNITVWCFIIVMLMWKHFRKAGAGSDL